MDAVEFFQLSAGRWRSQRTTHHLAFQRREGGDSAITVVSREAQDPKVIELCEFHQVDPNLAMGGAQVSWAGSMAWDREGEDKHQGSTVMALISEPGSDRRQGQLLREKGYAETAPVIGHFHMDAQDGLVLTTEYETMTVFERFWFPDPNIRLRTNAVKWFGGHSSASFCTEIRLADQEDPSQRPTVDATPNVNVEANRYLSVFGG